MPPLSTAAAAPGVWHIAHAGAVTSAGTSAWQSAASWVGLQKRFQKAAHPGVGPHAITTAPCPEITSGAVGISRLARLLGAALADVVSSMAQPGHDAEWAAPARMALALPERMSDSEGTDLWQQALAELGRWAGPAASATLGAVQCRFVRGGHTAGFAALQALGPCDPACGTALLMAVDSLLDTATLQAAHARSALLTDRHADGCIASEAAAALWLQAAPDTRDATGRGLVLHPPALATNATAHRLPQQAPEPEALQHALRSALAHARWQADNVGYTVSDFDGSTWRAMAQIPTRARMGQGWDPIDWEPAAVIGQVGAATGPVHWALAAQRLRHDARPPNSILSWALDEGTAAAAVALERTIGTVAAPHRRPPAHGHDTAAVATTYSARFLQNEKNG
ncbi:hypothetical protein RMR16_025220 (plasmid) [Agrobacterium sp. rho-13.3]|uniref:hypothetical protein n=1 Tax=Agrobacterium sp. rho-13.3 TaxID=3072980 RepID=UPI002A0C1202|nr:hypothetical protein [Agrobacterium sp. rho-13.3]MDX8310251.1 hypothetical protein [Agrobacterium sp. rho-13.3]